MTTTTDLLRRAAELLHRGPHRYDIIEFDACATSLLALADQMERAEPVAVRQWHAEFKCWNYDDIEDVLPSCKGERLYTHPAPEVTHPLEHLLPELCQLLDAFKREAENNGEGWTEWDESVRARLRKCIAEHNIAAMQEPKP